MAERKGDGTTEKGNKSGGRGVGKGRERGRGEAQTRRVCTTFGKDRWGDEVGCKRGSWGRDKGRREVVVGRLFGIREGEYARPGMGVGGVGRRGRVIRETTGARDEMGEEDVKRFQK